MATYKELQQQLKELHERAEQARSSEKAEVLQKIRNLIIEYQLLPGDLGFSALGEHAAPVAAKYRDPITGKTWSGRGRVPSWLTGDRSKYEI